MAYTSELETRIAKKVTRAITDHQSDRGRRSDHGRAVGRQGQLGADPDPRRAAEAGADRLLDRGGQHRLGLRRLRAPQADRDLRGPRLGAPRRAHQHRRDHRRHPGDDRHAVFALRPPAPRRALPSRRRRSAPRRSRSGHHADDFIETLLLNVFFQGAIKAMPARLVSDNGKHVVIRPLAYVLESEARAYAKEAESADHRLLLSGLRRSEPAAPADEALDRPARGRASGDQELDPARRSATSTRGTSWSGLAVRGQVWKPAATQCQVSRFLCN